MDLQPHSMSSASVQGTNGAEYLKIEAATMRMAGTIWLSEYW
jgi:hypothetical protein